MKENLHKLLHDLSNDITNLMSDLYETEHFDKVEKIGNKFNQVKREISVLTITSANDKIIGENE